MLRISQLAFLCFCLITTTARAQDVDKNKSKKAEKNPPKNVEYKFALKHGVDCTSVKSQDATGTCWSFATASFIESELMRRGKGEHNLSEMFIAKNIYREKALNYVLRQGKANFSQGALAHDFIGAAEKYGLVPEEVYSGKLDDEKHNHGELEAVTLGMLDAVLKRPRPSTNWQSAFTSVLDVYLGSSPKKFKYQGKKYTAKQFADSLDFRRDDYVSLTSYTHHPFYQNFVLEIPDNFSNGSFYNVPIDELMETIDHAIENGFSVAWDGDVSERGFSSKDGIAVLPKNADRKDVFKYIGKELTVNQKLRQSTLMSLETTDDHLMHLTGIATDPKGNKYYRIKNSWGTAGPFKGYLYASEAYLRLKTVAILVHRDGVPSKIRPAK